MENGREGECYQERRESRQCERKDNACVVSSLSLWHFGGQKGCVLLRMSPSLFTRFAELIRSLTVSKTKSLPNPSTIYNTDGREEGLTISFKGKKGCKSQ